MGVHGLWQLLQPAGQPVTLESLEGKVLAVDVSIWLHQTMKGMRDKDGNPLPNAHLQGLFSRICKLMFYRIKPIFVFDGGVPLLKKQTMAARRERKAEAERESNEISQKLLLNLIKSHAVRQTLGDMGGGNRRVPGIRKGRNQPDSDMFELAPLAESDKVGLTINAEEWERDFEFQENWIKEGLAAVSDMNTDSEEFRSLPMEIQHEVLNELKEQKKYHSLSRLTNMPEDSTDFSLYQLKKLMKQSKLTNQIVEVRKQMASKTSKDITFTLADEYHGGEVEAKRIISEDASHYVLIKGLTKKMQQEEADRYEIHNLVKLEKQEEDYPMDVGCDDGHGLVKDQSCFVPKVKGQSSDSEIEVETVMARRLNRKRHHKSKISHSARKTNNPKIFTLHKKSKQIVSSDDDDDDTLISSSGNLHPTDVSYSSEDEGFIEVRVDPATAAEDDLFPASIFQTNFGGNEKADNVKDGHYQQKANYASSEMTNVSPEKLLAVVDTKDSGRDSGDITLSNTHLGEKKKDLPMPSSVTDDVTLRRKNVLSEILSQLEKKKKQLINSQADIHDNMMTSFEESNIGGGFIIESSSKDQEERSVMTDESSTRFFMVSQPEIRFPDNIQQEPSCSLNNILDETNSLSESDDDLKIAIELSLQRPNNEEKVLAKTESSLPGTREETVSTNVVSHKSSVGTNKNLEPPEVNEQNLTKISSDSDNDADFVEVKSEVPFTQNSSIVTKQSESAAYGEANLHESEGDSQSEIADDLESSSIISESSEKNLSSENYHPQEKITQSQSTTESAERPMKTLSSQLQPDDYEIDHESIFQGVNEEGLEDARALLESERSALLSERGRHTRMATSITEQINLEAQELLRLFGIPFIVSPVEAEAQCAFLDITNQTQGTITDDSDIWLFGGRRVYKNFFNQSKHVEFFTCDSINNHFGLSRTQLINIALLCGSDYTEGIASVGPVRALEIMAEFPGEGLEGLYLFRKWWDRASNRASSQENKVRARLKDLKIISGFPSQTVVDAYLHPRVDDSTEKFSWGIPDLDMLREFAKYRFGWSKERSDQSLLPMFKQFTKKDSQGRIHTYFQPRHFIQTSKIKSVRLMKALELVKNQASQQENEAELYNNSHNENGKMADKSNKDKKLKKRTVVENNTEGNIHKEKVKAPERQLMGKISKKTAPSKKTMKNRVNDKQTKNEIVLVNGGGMEKEGIKVEEIEREVGIERNRVKVGDTEKFTMEEIIKKGKKQVRKENIGEKHKKQVSWSNVQDDVNKNSAQVSVNILDSADEQTVREKKEGEGELLNKVNHQEINNSLEFVKKAKINKSENRRGRRTMGSLCGRGAILVSLDHKERSRGQNLGSRKSVSSLGRGVVNLSESSNSGDDDSGEKESNIYKQVKQKQSSSKLSTGAHTDVSASGIQNIVYSSMENKHCQESLNTDDTANKVPLLMSAKLTRIKPDDRTTQNKDSEEVDIDISKADVSIINKQNLPSTLSYLNQRRRDEKLLLQQLKGKRAMNAIEKRLEEDERRSRLEKQKLEGINQSAGQTMSFEDIMGGLDAAVSVNIQNKGKTLPPYKKSVGNANYGDNVRQAKTYQERIFQETGQIGKSSSNKELDKRSVNKPNENILKSDSKSHALITISSHNDEKEILTRNEHHNPKNELLTRQEKSVEKIIFSANNEDFDRNERCASSKKTNLSVQDERTFKSNRSKVFDRPISEMGDYSSDFSDSGANKPRKFLKQLEHLGDSKSVKGHGPLPRQFAGQVIRGRAFAGKGKGRGKNRNNVEDVTGHSLESKISDNDVLEYASVTADDLGSDFSDCDI